MRKYSKANLINKATRYDYSRWELSTIYSSAAALPSPSLSHANCLRYHNHITLKSERNTEDTHRNKNTGRDRLGIVRGKGCVILVGVLARIGGFAVAIARSVFFGTSLDGAARRRNGSSRFIGDTTLGNLRGEKT